MNSLKSRSMSLPIKHRRKVQDLPIPMLEKSFMYEFSNRYVLCRIPYLCKSFFKCAAKLLPMTSTYPDVRASFNLSQETVDVGLGVTDFSDHFYNDEDEKRIWKQHSYFNTLANSRKYFYLTIDVLPLVKDFIKIIQVYNFEDAQNLTNGTIKSEKYIQWAKSILDNFDCAEIITFYLTRLNEADLDISTRGLLIGKFLRDCPEKLLKQVVIHLQIKNPAQFPLGYRGSRRMIMFANPNAKVFLNSIFKENERINEILLALHEESCHKVRYGQELSCLSYGKCYQQLHQR